jgi:hypothetical protein
VDHFWGHFRGHFRGSVLEGSWRGMDTHDAWILGLELGEVDHECHGLVQT